MSSRPEEVVAWGAGTICKARSIPVVAGALVGAAVVWAVFDRQRRRQRRRQPKKKAGVSKSIVLVGWSPHLDVLGERELIVGEPVFVRLADNAHEGAAVVLDSCVSAPAKWKGRVKVRFISNNTTAHVNPAKVGRLWTAVAGSAEGGGVQARKKAVVLVVESGDHFRKLARTEARAGDAVCAIGCNSVAGNLSTVLRATLSCAEDTLLRNTSLLYGVDSGSKACEAARLLLDADAKALVDDGKLIGVCRYTVECADVLADIKYRAPAAVARRKRRLERQAASGEQGGQGHEGDRWEEEKPRPAGAIVSPSNASKIFLDVGVSRPLPQVMQLLDELLQGTGDEEGRWQGPNFVVVRSQPLFKAIRTAASSGAPAADGGERKQGKGRKHIDWGGGVAATGLWETLTRVDLPPPQVSDGVAKTKTASDATAAPLCGEDDVPADLARFCQPIWLPQLEASGVPLGGLGKKLLSRLQGPIRSKVLGVASRRMGHFVCVLERLYDLGNIAAVMRSAEAFGVGAVYLVGERSDHMKPFRVQGRVSVGAEKWLDVYWFPSVGSCITKLHKEGYHVAAAHCPADEADQPRMVDSQASPKVQGFCELEQLTVTPGHKTAVLFGNEHVGVSSEALAMVDSCLYIGTTGFTQSLNVSVAAAVTFHSVAARQPGGLGPPVTPEDAVNTHEQAVAELCARALVSRGWDLEALSKAALE